jgi:hypothetical protein
MNKNVIEIQELSARLAQEFINSEDCKNVQKDVVLRNLMANGYAYGAYMGWHWATEQEKTGLVSTIKRAFTSGDVEFRADDAATYCLKKKFRGVTTQDREVLRFALGKGFKRGVQEYETKNPQ